MELLFKKIKHFTVFFLSSSFVFFYTFSAEASGNVVEALFYKPESLGIESR
jgi:hypothetical protein